MSDLGSCFFPRDLNSILSCSKQTMRTGYVAACTSACSAAVFRVGILVLWCSFNLAEGGSRCRMPFGEYKSFQEMRRSEMLELEMTSQGLPEALPIPSTHRNAF